MIKGEMDIPIIEHPNIVKQGCKVLVFNFANESKVSMIININVNIIEILFSVKNSVIQIKPHKK